MDPNLFHLDRERTLEALVGVMVLAFVLERALALLFETRWWVRNFEDPRVCPPPKIDTPPRTDCAPGEALKLADPPKPVAPPPHRSDRAKRELKYTEGSQRFRAFPWKEAITFGVAYLVCRHWDFDAVSVIFLQDRTQPLGQVLTAAVTAGGSKASVKLFQDLLGVKSSAVKEREALRKE